ncbi:MAG: hypothetical protein ACPHX1_04205, partial [Porticoccaceae bacterium]
MFKQNILKLASLIWFASFLNSMSVHGNDVEHGIEEQVVFRDGMISEEWDLGLNAWDQGIDWNICSDSSGCPNIDFGITSDTERGDVVFISHADNDQMNAAFFESSNLLELGKFTQGGLAFDIKPINGYSEYYALITCVYPCEGYPVPFSTDGSDDWQTIHLPVSEFMNDQLNEITIDQVNAITISADIWRNTLFHLDNIYFTTNNDPDNDGVPSVNDAFPIDPLESTDSDNDGIGNNADSDDDNDGILDSDDAFPFNPMASVDTDSDGYPNYFEIELLSQGVVPDEWDLGLVGASLKIYLYDNYEPFRVDGELTLCEDSQSRNFQTFESLVIPPASQGSTGFYVDYDCDKFKLAANPPTMNNDEGFLDIEYFGSSSRWYDNLTYLNSGIFISRSQSIDLSGYENLYLEVEMKSDFPVLWPFASNSALQLHFIDNSFQSISFDGSPNSIGGADLRCFGESQRLNDSPFDQQDCDYRTYRFPLDSAYFSNLNGVLVSIPNLFDHENCQDDGHDEYDYDYDYGYGYECESLSSKHQIKNIKIIGGDQFPNNPDEYKDPDFDGIGSNQDSDNDNDGIPNNIDSDEYNPAVWLADDFEDIDSDCIPDSVDNDLDSVRDTDCDGLNDDIDTDDDNDSIPDSLIVNVIQDGTVNLGWTPSSLDHFNNNNSDCLFESALTAEEIASCEFISLSYNPQATSEIERSENAFFEVWTQRYDELRLNLEDARIALLQVDPDDTEAMNTAFENLLDIEGEMEDMEELSEDMGDWFGDAFYSNDYLGFALDFSEIINIDSVDPASEYLPAGYLEIEISSTDLLSGDQLEISLLTSLGEHRDKYIHDIEQYSQQTAGGWGSIKIPLYEFFNNENYNYHNWLEPQQYNQRKELSRIKGMRLQFYSNPRTDIHIRNIRFVIEDKFPLLAVENPSAEFSSIDFDSDGIIGWNDSRPMMADFDTDNDGVIDSEDWDIDGDDLDNYYEDEIGTDPYNADTDGDGINDGNDPRPMIADFDTDNDGVIDSEDWDIDGDGLDNYYEDEIGTDPYNADTDGDGTYDGYDPYPNDSSMGGSDDPNNIFDEYIIFADGVNDSWPLWDCCGGSSPITVIDDAEHDEVAEFHISAAPTVLGFNSRSDFTEFPSEIDASPIISNGVLQFEMKVVNFPYDSSAFWLMKVESRNAATFAEVPLTSSIEGVAPELNLWQ